MNNKLDIQYQNLLKFILENGVKKQTRNGDVVSVFGCQIRHNMQDGFPLLTTKKMAWKQIVTELMWFLRGDTNIKYLVDNDCHIWDGDAFKRYDNTYKGNYPMDMEEFVEAIKTNDEFSKVWGDLGPIYGKQWRSWEGLDKTIDTWEDFPVEIDQIANLISELKTNPDSRRLMVSAWNVGELDQMVLPPCHYGFQVWTRELSYDERNELYKEKFGEYIEDTDARWEMSTSKTFIDDLNEHNIPKRAISLLWNQRSVDTFLGLPFNIASYGLLLEILAKSVNMVSDQLIGNLGDTHLYLNHIEQAKEQMDRTPYELPKLIYNTPVEVQGLYLDPNNFTLENYKSHPKIKAELSN